jgi:hypothetical protein
VNEVETQRQEILTLRAENEKLKEAEEKQNHPVTSDKNFRSQNISLTFFVKKP